MATEAPVAPPPAAPISARPPTPVNPTSQKRPTPPASVQPPVAPRPPARGPDLSKVPGSPISPESQLKQASETLTAGIKKLFADPAPAAPAAATPPAEPKVAPAEPAPVAAPTPPAELAKVEPASPVDHFAGVAEPENLSDKGKQGWSALKKEAAAKIEAAEKKLADAQGELETLKKATPAEVAEVERLKAEHKAAVDRLAIIDLPNHPDYIAQFTKPKTEAIAEATEVLAYTGKEATDIASLLGKQQKDFNAEVAKLTEGMNSMDATTVQTALRKAYKIAADEKNAQSKAVELKTGIESKRAMENKQAFEETYGKLGSIETLVSPKQAPDNASLEEKQQVADYNAALAKVRNAAESNVFGKLTPKGAATIGIKAAYLDVIVNQVLPTVEKGYAAMIAQNKALQEENKALKGAKNPGSFNAPAAEPDKPTDAKEYLRRAFPR